MGRRAILAIVMGLSACGGGSAASPDAGLPDAEIMITIAAPAPPVFTPCPAGWREVEGGDVTVCDPWPATGRVSTCAADEAHFPGEPGCARIGTACPAGDWPEGLPAGASILHVRPGAPAGGDGSQAAPYATIAE